MNLNIHRYLDEAFAGIESSAETQDLKEEIRGNVSARAEELEAGGMTADAAARAAMDEVGPIRDLIDAVAPPTSRSTSVVEVMARNRIRPNPAFVVRTVVLALLLASSVIVAALAAFAGVPGAFGLVAAVVAALTVGTLVADALRQETSQNYRLPTRRALLFGLAAFTALLGVALAAQFAWAGVWVLVVGGIFAAAALVAFISLGVTQTNRKKAWALELHRRYMGNDRFSEDPASAARFGIYTVVIWLVTALVFFVLSATIGYAWSWVAGLGGMIVFFLTLAKMLFPAKTD